MRRLRATRLQPNSSAIGSAETISQILAQLQLKRKHKAEQTMPQALVDLSLGHGFSAQIFSGPLHLAGRSRPVIQFRVRDSQRQRVWTFRVHLADEVGDGGGGPRDQPFLSAARRPQYEQATFEAEVSNRQAGGGPPAGSAADATAASSARLTTLHRQGQMPPSRPVIAPMPPTARPPAHLVRPGLRPRPPTPGLRT